MLLRNENALQVLEDLTDRRDVSQTVKLLAALTLYQCDLDNNDPDTLKRLKTSESIIVPDEFLRRKHISI